MEELKSKFSNIFIMYLFAIMSNDCKKCAHFLNDDMDAKLMSILENNKNNNEIEMFDELNVTEINIFSNTEKDGVNTVRVGIKAKYKHYYIDATTKQFKRGNNESREEETYTLTFVKSLNAKELPCNVKCGNCGGNLEINFTGECPWCNTLINVEDYEYIMTSMVY